MYTRNVDVQYLVDEAYKDPKGERRDGNEGTCESSTEESGGESRSEESSGEGCSEEGRGEGRPEEGCTEEGCTEEGRGEGRPEEGCGKGCTEEGCTEEGRREGRPEEGCTEEGCRQAGCEEKLVFRSHNGEIEWGDRRLSPHFPDTTTFVEFDERPWGNYLVLDEGAGYKVKRIVVYPGRRLSLQRHRRRQEHWTVITGIARVTCGEAVFDLDAAQSVDIPLGFLHRLENPGTEPLVIIEVQHGDYLGEDDIERISDDFGRVS